MARSFLYSREALHHRGTAKRRSEGLRGGAPMRGSLDTNQSGTNEETSWTGLATTTTTCFHDGLDPAQLAQPDSTRPDSSWLAVRPARPSLPAPSPLRVHRAAVMTRPTRAYLVNRL